MSKSARSRRARKQLRLSNGQFATPGQKIAEIAMLVGIGLVVFFVIAVVVGAA